MLRVLLLSLCFLMLTGCANVVAPDGAPMDIPASTAIALKTPAPTPTPQPYHDAPKVNAIEQEDTREHYKCRVNEAYLRSGPDKSNNDNIVGMLSYEEEVILIESGVEFTRVQLNNGGEAYCYTDFLVSAGEPLYAYLRAETGQKLDIPTGQPLYNDDGSPVMVKNELVDLRLYLPDAKYDLLFATERNIIGEPLYPRAIPLIQKDTALKLQKAFELFKNDGYILKVYDAYRPLSVQRRLFNVVKNSNWIANPNTTASNHNRGCAVDISLIDDSTQMEIEFPTPMHTFSVDAARDSKSWSNQARANVDYMTKVMSDCGFNHIKSEWWHFADSKSKNYMTTDINLGKLTMMPKQEDRT